MHGTMPQSSRLGARSTKAPVVVPCIMSGTTHRHVRPHHTDRARTTAQQQHGEWGSAHPQARVPIDPASDRAQARNMHAWPAARAGTTKRTISHSALQTLLCYGAPAPPRWPDPTSCRAVRALVRCRAVEPSFARDYRCAQRVAIVAEAVRVHRGDPSFQNFYSIYFKL
jgi:hypothetical protein